MKVKNSVSFSPQVSVKYNKPYDKLRSRILKTLNNAGEIVKCEKVGHNHTPEESEYNSIQPGISQLKVLNE